MNKQQKALRLALEALEVLGWQPTEEAMDYRDNAITAIREALVEQQESVQGFKNRLADAIAKMPFGDTAASFAVFVRNFE